MRLRTLLLTLLALTLAVPATAAARRVIPPGFVGANWDEDIANGAPRSVQASQFDRMARAGAESVRAVFLWASAQPDPGGPINFRSTDPVVAMASAHGLSVLPIVIEAPDWARQSPSQQYSPPANNGDYDAYLRALIERYGPNGTFWPSHPHVRPMPIRYWQIWNEPNMNYQFTVPSDEGWALPYSTMVKDAWSEIKADDPGAKLVLAGLANNSPEYLSHLYHYGIHGYFDVASIHPYTATAQGVVELVQQSRGVMNYFQDARKQLWVTELGLPASKGKSTSQSTLQTTDSGMSSFLSQSYHGLIHNVRKLNVGRVYWYTWASSYNPHPGIAIFDFAGLVKWVPGSSRVSLRPAFSAFVAIARKYEGCAKGGAGTCARASKARH